jgi:hypothetical protein
MRKYIDLEEYLDKYTKFKSIPTWTKVKRERYDEFINFFTKHEHVNIISKRDSNTTKVHLTDDFIIFRVKENQRGYMKLYRTKWVLMYCNYRYTWTHYLSVYPLNKSFSVEKTNSLLNKFDYSLNHLENE